MLTSRRKDYLAAVVQLHRETGTSVHYTEVAERLGVSKWTAYDLLKLLAEEGLLAEECQVDKKEGAIGRSLILFYPTPRAHAALSESEGAGEQLAVEGAGTTSLAIQMMAPGEAAEDWNGLTEELRRKLTRVKEEGVTTVLKETLAELPRVRSPVRFCAYVILVLLLTIWALRQHTQVPLLVGHLLSSFTTPEATLTLFVGAALALILRSNPSREIVAGLRECVPAYVQQVKNIGHAEQTALLAFMHEAIHELPTK